MAVEIDTEIIERQRKVLEAALTSNPEMERRLQKHIRAVLMEARKDIVGDISARLKSDPRGAAQAVRTSVYRAVLGGNVNIFNSKKAHGVNTYEPQRNPSPRGGNRRQRSSSTQRIMSYAPLDRGFILRFVNDGTGDRTINFRSDSRRERVNRGSRGGNKYGKTINTGLRGKIAPRHFFGPSAQRWVQQAADNLSRLIYMEVQKIINES
jgi:hypothetical protein